MWVARALLEEGVQVRVLARRGSDRRNIADLRVQVAEGDLLDPASLRAALAGCEELYHVAAFYSASGADGPRMYEINVDGTKNILRAASEAGVQRIVHTSTIGTIGRPTDGSLPTEDTEFNLWETSSAYARSKYLAEVAAKTWAEAGLPVVIVNPCAPVGAGDIKPSSSGKRIVDYLAGRVPSYLEGGINMIAVRDVAAGHLLAARRGQPGRRYILGNAKGNLSRAAFYRLMEQVSHVPPPRPPARHPLRRLWEALRPRRRGAQPAALTCRPTRAIEDLGLPQTPLEQALAEAVAWFREKGYV